MARVPIHYVDLRAFCYATEDEKRVEQALRAFLPEDADIERAESEGHHGNRIVVLSARVENADAVRHVLGRVSELPDLEAVLADLERRVDEDCALFVRFDKQAAFRDEIRLSEGITLRAKIEAYPARKEAAVENARETFESLGDEDGTY